MARELPLNIADLTRYDEIIRSMMIAPHIQRRETIDPEPKHLDGDCVILECPPEQARAILEFLRLTVDTRAKQRPIRAYQRTDRGSWKKA